MLNHDNIDKINLPENKSEIDLDWRTSLLYKTAKELFRLFRFAKDLHITGRMGFVTTETDKHVESTSENDMTSSLENSDQPEMIAKYNKVVILCDAKKKHLEAYLAYGREPGKRINKLLAQESFAFGLNQFKRANIAEKRRSPIRKRFIPK